MIKSNKQEKVNANNNQANTNTQKKEKTKENKKVEEKKEEQVAQTPLKKAKKNGLKLQALNHALPKNL